jgi:F-type H+-transporting ATPase subunit b
VTTLESRKSQILENIEAAEKQRQNSEEKLKEYEEIVSKSKMEAKSIFNQAREKALKDISAKKKFWISKLMMKLAKQNKK